MKRNLVFGCLLLTLIFQACSKKSTEPDSNTGLDFSGITYTDETGTITGSVDKDDWNMVLVSGDPSKDTAVVVVKDSSHYTSPKDFSFNPAYPNPATNGPINFRFSLKVPSTVYLYVCDKPDHIIAKLIDNEQLVTGAYQYTYNKTDFTDKQVLRAFLEITSENGNKYKSYGDFQFVK